jgi:glycosyltransferase involved in cell wall biosynthesis
LWGAQQDMARVYQAANVVVLPSYREGMPKVLLEASACGRAVVTTDAPGCRDAVIEGVTGFIVPVRDSTQLAERIKTLLLDPNRRKAMGDAGRVFVVGRFSTHEIVTQMLKVFSDLLQSVNKSTMRNGSILEFKSEKQSP